MIQRVWRGAELATTGGSMVSLALAAAARVPDRVALIDGLGDGRTLYRELADRALRVAFSMAAKGLRKGDVVATLTPNSSQWVTFALGSMAAGGIVTGMNPLLRPDEIVRQLTVSAATIVAVASRLLPALEAAGIDKLVDEIIVLDDGAASGHCSLADLIRDGRPEPRMPAPDDVALLPFSSGSSGLPKGVEIPGRSLALAAESAGEALRLTDADVLLAAAPFFHIVGLSGVLAPAFARGLPVVIVPTPEFESLLGAIERHRVTLPVLTPPAIRALAGHPAVERHDLSSLRGIGCTAAPLSAELQTTAARRVGATTFQAYGMTESVGAIAVDTVSGPRPGSCGMPAPGFEIRIVDPDTGEDTARESTGEIWFRSPTMMRAYHGDPGATAEIMHDGWLRTGDLGFFDADGYLFIVDRLKDLIKVGSSQVAPAELETVIAGFPGVADVAVAGRPSPSTGECPVAYVVASTPIDPDSLAAWVAERVAPFKRLQAVEFVDAIPRQPNGKIMRRLLRARA